MKLEHEFYKLPLRFDIKQLRRELDAFEDSDWQKHPTDYKGNFAIPLISVNGEINDDFAGPMKTTQHLHKSPYMQQVIASFNSIYSRSRLMLLEGRQEVPLHSDINYHWWSRVRIHVPIVTTPDVIFHCGNQQVHMAAGEAWIFDSWKLHRVVNPSGKTRVHLVIDTAGSPDFWDLVSRAKPVSSTPWSQDESEPVSIAYQRTKERINLELEKHNVPVVMSAGEVDAMLDVLVQDVRSNAGDNNDDDVARFVKVANSFRQGWRSIWSMHGTAMSGWSDYQGLVEKTQKQLLGFQSPLLSNRSVANQVMVARILSVAVNPEFSESATGQSNKVSTAGNEPAVIHQEKIGRNSPCPCGSGKKYKRCHGA